MHPTMFDIPFLPDWLAEVKSYGLMMMVGFLSGIWLACRRGMKSQANPDIVLNVGFIALIFGVIGARLMFVFHYWDTNFAIHDNPILAAFDIRAGGLEFWGGPILVIPTCVIYLRFIAKVSARWYLDIMMPSLAWGLAVTRIGCYLNGCCWGAVCVDQHDPARHKAAGPWAVRFPYGSPALAQQYKFGQITLPRELIFNTGSGESYPIPRDLVDAYAGSKGEAYRAARKLSREVAVKLREQRATGADGAAIEGLKADAVGAKAIVQKYAATLGLVDAQCRKYGMTPNDLETLASYYRSKPVHPAQLYAMINAFIICWVLGTMYYYRKRHGILLGWFLILYSISRVFLELIRQDNPLDVGGLTISQSISIGTFLIGVFWLWLVHTKMPLYSPRAIRFELEEEEAGPAPKAKKGR